jgi:hypothetical protein
MNDHKRPMRGDKFLAGQFDLVLNEARGFSGEPGLAAGGPRQDDCKQSDCRGAQRRNCGVVLVNEGAGASDIDARDDTAGKLFLGGFLAAVCFAAYTLLK